MQHYHNGVNYTKENALEKYKYLNKYAVKIIFVHTTLGLTLKRKQLHYIMNIERILNKLAWKTVRDKNSRVIQLWSTITTGK